MQLSMKVLCEITIMCQETLHLYISMLLMHTFSKQRLIEELVVLPLFIQWFHFRLAFLQFLYFR